MSFIIPGVDKICGIKNFHDYGCFFLLHVKKMWNNHDKWYDTVMCTQRLSRFSKRADDARIKKRYKNQFMAVWYWRHVPFIISQSEWWNHRNCCSLYQTISNSVKIIYHEVGIVGINQIRLNQNRFGFRVLHKINKITRNKCYFYCKKSISPMAQQDISNTSQGYKCWQSVFMLGETRAKYIFYGLAAYLNFVRLLFFSFSALCVSILSLHCMVERLSTCIL